MSARPDVHERDVLPVFLATVAALKSAGCYSQALRLAGRLNGNTMRHAVRSAVYAEETGKPGGAAAVEALKQLATKMGRIFAAASEAERAALKARSARGARELPNGDALSEEER